MKITELIRVCFVATLTIFILTCLNKFLEKSNYSYENRNLPSDLKNTVEIGSKLPIRTKLVKKDTIASSIKVTASASSVRSQRDVVNKIEITKPRQPKTQEQAVSLPLPLINKVVKPKEIASASLVSSSSSSFSSSSSSSLPPPSSSFPSSSLSSSSSSSWFSRIQSTTNQQTQLNPNCPSSVSDLYRKNESSLNSNGLGLKWCEDKRDSFNVVLGRNWGGLPREMQIMWDEAKCNELLVLNKLQTCDERWGWKSFDDWRANVKTYIAGQSSVICASNLKTSTFCRLGNVTLDFSKVEVMGRSRAFHERILTTYG